MVFVAMALSSFLIITFIFLFIGNLTLASNNCYAIMKRRGFLSSNTSHDMNVVGRREGKSEPHQDPKTLSNFYSPPWNPKILHI